ncbi:hypothetical protein QI305_12085 [Staphylococcus saprophyticus]|nr:hypothetical protein [Staphylococcus saprophyticus]
MMKYEYINQILMLQQQTDITNYKAAGLKRKDEKALHEIYCKLRDQVLHQEIQRSGIFK